MFHTFSGFNPSGTRVNSGPGSNSSAGRRRTNTVRACEQCRRRKIRCDGQRPCEACQWYQKTELCRYADPLPQQKTMEKLSSNLNQYETIFSKLFPGIEVNTLMGLTANQLIALATKGKPPRPVSPAISPPSETQVSPPSTESDNLEALQSMPEESPESRKTNNHDAVNNVIDDVNSLSLSNKTPSSYLGASSVHAAIKVMAFVRPEMVPHMSDAANWPHFRGSTNQYPPWVQALCTRIQREEQPYLVESASPTREEQRIVDAYFSVFHFSTPMLDELSFRETFLSRRRNDQRWQALLNIVLTLGSIAANSAKDKSHCTYFQRVKRHLDLDSLGTPHLETVITLGLLGGHYLHYISQPNLAYSLIGSALRMAASLGLHKELHESAGRQTSPSIVDQRRRVWWSLVCLDIWGSQTLGRPSLGRWSADVTTKLPHCTSDSELFFTILPLTENVRFCRVVAQIQEIMSVTPLMNHTDMQQWDRQLADWYESLPPLLKTHEPCPDTLVAVRAGMRWRLHVQRMLLFRPALLSYAMRRIPYVALRSEERTAVDKCFAHAAEAIRDISSAKCTSQIWGWNAVWFLFQSVLIPILGLYINDSSNSNVSCSPEAFQAQVEAVIASLIRMRPWSPFAVPTLNGVCRLYEARRAGEESPGNLQQNDGTLTPVTLGPSDPSSDMVVKSSSPSDFDTQLNAEKYMADQPQTIPHPSLAMTFSMGNSPDQNMWDYITWSDERVGTDYALAQFNATFSNDAINQYFDKFGQPLVDPYAMGYSYDEPTPQAYQAYQTYPSQVHPGQ